MFTETLPDGARPGALFGNAFVLQRMLGQGGMGQVWHAYHLETGADVALKFMTEASFIFPDCRKLFAREMRATAAVHSPHVVECVASIDDGEVPYMVLEKLDGEELGAYVSRTGPMPFALAREVIRQLCEAVRATHEAGVIHCDVKCQNVILSFDRTMKPVVKLIDFGLARRRDEGPLDSDARPSGTPHAMSPEQMLTPNDVDEAADYWGICVVAYHAITGALPFGGTSMASILCAIATHEFLDVSYLRRGAPKQMDGFFGKAFHRQRDERFETLDELFSTLDSLLGLAIGQAPEEASDKARHPEYPRFTRTRVGDHTFRLGAPLGA
jgi:serine/threonine-protein kinase